MTPAILLIAKVVPSYHQRFASFSIAGVITKLFDPMTTWREVTAHLSQCLTDGLTDALKFRMELLQVTRSRITVDLATSD